MDCFISIALGKKQQVKRTSVSPQVHEIFQDVQHSRESRKDEHFFSLGQDIAENLVQEDKLGGCGDEMLGDLERL